MRNGWFHKGFPTPGTGVPEVAVYLARITDLPYREAAYWKRLVRLDKENSRPQRVYFGNEFCQERIPERAELEASCAAVREAGLPLSFVTPPVNDRGCEKLLDRLMDLEEWCPGSEVVVNDWGVLRVLHDELPSLVPVLGRLMTKLLRDPRITPRYVRPDAPPPELSALQRCSLSISAYRRLLARFGVKRIELDNLYQGIDIDFRALGLLASLYVPFGYVTTGRICLLGNQHLPADEKFAVPDGGCPRPCLRFEIELAHPKPGADGETSYTQRGNTIFYRHTTELVSRGVSWAAGQGARLVFQPEIPF